MQQQTSSGGVLAGASSPLSGSASASSPPSSPQSKQAKLGLANEARLMQDSWANLEATAATNKKLREQSLRLREAQVNKTIQEYGAMAQPQNPANEGAEDAMGDILIDSPVTHTHNNYYPPNQGQASSTETPGQSLPPAPASGGFFSSKLGKAALMLAGLLGAGGGVAGIASLMNQQQPANTAPVPVVNDGSKGRIRTVYGKGPDGKWVPISKTPVPGDTPLGTWERQPDGTWKNTNGGSTSK